MLGPVITNDPDATPSGPSSGERVITSLAGVARAVLSTMDKSNWLVMLWKSGPKDRVNQSWSSPD